MKRILHGPMFPRQYATFTQNPSGKENPQEKIQHLSVKSYLRQSRPDRQ